MQVSRGGCRLHQLAPTNAEWLESVILWSEDREFVHCRLLYEFQVYRDGVWVTNRGWNCMISTQNLRRIRDGLTLLTLACAVIVMTEFWL